MEKSYFLNTAGIMTVMVESPPFIITQVSLHGERVEMEQGVTQTVDSAWLSLRTQAGQNLFVNAALGKAKVKNQNFTPGKKDDGLFTSLMVSQRF